jgi:glycosyltransferase involved in cell wall biosynthesis
LILGAILPHTLLFGGVRRYIEMSGSFRRGGHEFIIYTPSGDPPRWTNMAGIYRPLSSIAERRHDIMMTGSPEHLESLEAADSRIRIFYLQLEGIDREREVVRRKGIRIMANSIGLMERIRRRYGADVLDGRGGINPELFHPPVSGAGLGGGPLRVLCYGRLSRPRKGTRFVTAAVAEMYRRGYDVELALFDSIGPGMKDPRKGFDPGVPFRFYINIPQERMRAMYASADVFVSAEHRAGWSNTCAEAAACGLPLVCTESGTMDFAEDGETALIIRSRGRMPVLRALKRIYVDREGARRMGAAGAGKMLEFTWDALRDRMTGQFERLLDERVVMTD